MNITKKDIKHSMESSNDIVIGPLELKYSINEDGTPFLNVYHLKVQENFQGEGIGTAVLEGIECFAKEKGISSIHITIQNSNELVVDFLEENGYDVIGPYPHRRYDYELVEGQKMF